MLKKVIEIAGEVYTNWNRESRQRTDLPDLELSMGGQRGMIKIVHEVGERQIGIGTVDLASTDISTARQKAFELMRQTKLNAHRGQMKILDEQGKQKATATFILTGDGKLERCS